MVHFLPMNIYQERIIQWLAWDRSRGIDLADYQYAERAGMKAQAFSRIKHGHRKKPASPTVEKLALAFEVSIDEFFAGPASRLDSSPPDSIPKSADRETEKDMKAHKKSPLTRRASFSSPVSVLVSRPRTDSGMPDSDRCPDAPCPRPSAIRTHDRCGENDSFCLLDITNGTQHRIPLRLCAVRLVSPLCIHCAR